MSASHYSTALPRVEAAEGGMQAKARGLVGITHGRKPTPDHGSGRTCEGCGCQLSRYNPDELCSACMPEGAFVLGGGPRHAAFRVKGSLPVMDPDAPDDDDLPAEVLVPGDSYGSVPTAGAWEVIRLYHSGLTLKEVGAAVGMSESGVCRLLKRHGVQARQPGYRSQRRNRERVA